MKGKIRKGIAVLGLMALTAAAMAGCKTSGKTPESQAVTDMPVPLETEDTTQGVQDSDTAALNNRDENNNYVGPLCEEQKELDVFFAIGGANFSGAQTFTQQLIDSNPSYQKLSENTNIKINYIVPAVGEEAAQFNLLIAFPTIISG